jgi:cytochrome c oxidase assembly protein subunit 15
MPGPDSQISHHAGIVRLWLLAVAALVFVMVLVGGATRLTESGLSIVEWKLVTGMVPPLSQADWEAEFSKYKTIPQYTQLNRGMNLDEFKTIYWWEWAHRALGRIVGAAFLLPFLFFLWRGWIEPRWRLPLWGIFGLGALQGAVGWWMVSSGLTERVSVSQYRLAFHLTLACVIYAALVWAAQMIGGRRTLAVSRDVRKSARSLVLLVLLQIYLGALVAGLDAGLTFNTWPLIDGSFIPTLERMFFEQPAWRNFFENALTVQFNHRMMAYILWAAALLHALQARDGAGWNGASLLAVAVTAQAVLGIVTLLYQAALPLALAHQAMAMIVLTVAVLHAQRSSGEAA